MPGYDTEIRVSTKVDTSQMQKLQIQIDKATNKVTTLNAKYEELKNKKIPTEAYVALENNLKAAKSELDKYIATEDKLSAAGLAIGAPWDNVIAKEAEAQLKIEDIQAKMQALTNTGRAFTLGADIDEIAKVAGDLSMAKAELRALLTRQEEMNGKNRKLSDGLKRVGKAGRNAFSSMNQHIKRSGGLLGTLGNRLKGIALSLLVFNWITKAFNAMISGMKSGFNNLVQYSDKYNQSVSALQSSNLQLQNSFAAAFAPIVQMVIPYLVQLINYVIAAVNTIAQLGALLSGQATWTRAAKVQKNYAASLNGTASAAKKAAGALAKFDDLDVLNKSDAGAAGSSGEMDPGDMFEEVPIDPKLSEWLSDLLEKIRPFLDYVKDLKDVFMDGFMDGLGDYEYRFDIIQKGLDQIKQAMFDIWTDPAVLSAADSWIKSFVYMLGSFVGSLTSIGLTLAAAFIGGFGDYLSNNTERIKKHIISMFNVGSDINNLFAGLFQSIAHIFEAFASSSGIRFMSALIGTMLDAGMGLLEVAQKLGRDILEMIILPITENADEFKTVLEGMLSAGANIFEGFKATVDSIFDNLNLVYDEKFKPFFDSVAKGISSIVNKFLEMWNTYVSPMLDDISSKLGDLFANYIAPLVNQIVLLLGNIMAILQQLWETILQPIFEVLVSEVFPVLTEIIGVFIDFIILSVEGIIEKLTIFLTFINDVLLTDWQEVWETCRNVFESFWNMIQAILSAIKENFINLFDVIKKLVNGDWKGAWESAQKIFTSFKDKVTDIVNSVKNYLESFFSWVGDMINWVLESIGGIGESIASLFSGNSGISPAGYSATNITRNINYSDIEDVPALANGAVIRGGNPFMAILGDQPAGHTNIEAPESAIVEAVEKGMSKAGISGGDVTINLNYDGETFARLFMKDFFTEMNRQGYDIDMLGGLT